MPSPVTPSDIEETIPTSTGSICSKLEALFSLAQKLSTFWDWAFNTDGTFTEEFVADVISPGIVTFWPVASNIPTGWVAANGAIVSRETYAGIFSKYGTQFGAGDGSTTFQLPDYRDKFLIGASGTKAAASTGGSFSATLVAANIPELDITVKDEIERFVVQEGSGPNSLGADAGVIKRETAEDIFNPVGTETPTPVNITNPYAAGVWIIKV